MALISSLTVLVLNHFNDVDVEHLDFMNGYLDMQREALTQRKEIAMPGYPISFYKSGRVNQARTVEFEKHKVIVHLGTGYLTYE